MTFQQYNTAPAIQLDANSSELNSCPQSITDTGATEVLAVGGRAEGSMQLKWQLYS